MQPPPCPPPGALRLPQFWHMNVPALGRCAGAPQNLQGFPTTIPRGWTPGCHCCTPGPGAATGPGG
jgi:hypothetical protein